MATKILLTVDTELLWRYASGGQAWQDAYARSYGPADVGVPYQLRQLADHDLRAVFFVDPMPALHFGIEPIRRMVAPILEAGQSVELHLHPQWSRLVEGKPTSSFEMIDYPEDEQRALIEQACDLLMQAGAPRPIAFRAGSYSANDATLRAAAGLGLRYDSSHNGADHPWPSAVSLSRDLIAPIRHQGITEIPVTLIQDPSGIRPLQICAVSLREMEAALLHALDRHHPVATIVSHSFELAARNSHRPNRIHTQRFEGLCAFLDQHRAHLPTCSFADLEDVPLDTAATPLPSALFRTWLRQAEQLWSNVYEERSA